MLCTRVFSEGQRSYEIVTTLLLPPRYNFATLHRYNILLLGSAAAELIAFVIMIVVIALVVFIVVSLCV